MSGYIGKRWRSFRLPISSLWRK